MTRNRKPELPKKLNDLLRKELIHLLPFSAAILDPSFRVVYANRNFEEFFGNWRERSCHQVCKGLKSPCPKCLASLSFADGKSRVSDETGVDRQGRTCHYIVHLAPLQDENGEIPYLVEMFTDVTATKLRQREYDLLFERVPCYISVIDRDFRIVRANEKARQTFEVDAGEFCYQAYKWRETPCPDCPAAQTFQDGQERVTTQVGLDHLGRETHYIVTTAPLSRGPGDVAHVIEIAADITRLRALEKEKLEAERLAAVGQTVAGLAHTIKNLLMGLEGGMYMLDSGLQRSDAERLMEGWEVLQRNFNKTVTLVKDFLSFAKGRLPVLRPTDANVLVQNIIELYRETAQRQGVELTCELQDQLPNAPLDPDGIEACLTNLISNAIDAAMMRENGGGKVVIATRESDAVLCFEVRDNGCGMDSEVKRRVFTTFFTTKASKGTGLGLLTTRKIVQEHGGSIEVESEPDQGSIFRIRLPRENLNLIAEEAAAPAVLSN